MKIIYEDNHIIIINKESGLLTQQDYSTDNSLIDEVKRYIKKKYNKPGDVFLGMVHRLDKPVSGIIMFAKTSKAASRLAAQFKNREVDKLYIAVTSKNKKEDNEKNWKPIEGYLLKQRGFSLVLNKQQSNAKLAKLSYRIIDTNEKFSLALVSLETGRKHQIRAQLSNEKLPIVGDKKYRSKIDMNIDQICLHSYHLSFVHPTLKEKMTFVEDPPKHFSEKFELTQKLKLKIDNLIEEYKHS